MTLGGIAAPWAWCWTTPSSWSSTLPPGGSHARRARPSGRQCPDPAPRCSAPAHARSRSHSVHVPGRVTGAFFKVLAWQALMLTARCFCGIADPALVSRKRSRGQRGAWTLCPHRSRRLRHPWLGAVMVAGLLGGRCCSCVRWARVLPEMDEGFGFHRSTSTPPRHLDHGNDRMMREVEQRSTDPRGRRLVSTHGRSAGLLSHRTQPRRLQSWRLRDKRKRSADGWRMIFRNRVGGYPAAMALEFGQLVKT